MFKFDRGDIVKTKGKNPKLVTVVNSTTKDGERVYLCKTLSGSCYLYKESVLELSKKWTKSMEDNGCIYSNKGSLTRSKEYDSILVGPEMVKNQHSYVTIDMHGNKKVYQLYLKDSLSKDEIHVLLNRAKSDLKERGLTVMEL